MKKPAVIIIDASLLFLADGHTLNQSVQPLLAACEHAKIPLYLSGSNMYCKRVPGDIVEKFEAVFPMNHCSGMYWYSIALKHWADMQHVFYISSNLLWLNAMQVFNITSVLVFDAYTSSQENIVGSQYAIARDYLFKDFAAFTERLMTVLQVPITASYTTK